MFFCDFLNEILRIHTRSIGNNNTISPAPASSLPAVTADDLDGNEDADGFDGDEDEVAAVLPVRVVSALFLLDMVPRRVQFVKARV
jgi:hypothetical protein